MAGDDESKSRSAKGDSGAENEQLLLLQRVKPQKKGTESGLQIWTMFDLEEYNLYLKMLMYICACIYEWKCEHNLWLKFISSFIMTEKNFADCLALTT